MKTQAELRADFQRFLEEDKVEEAEVVLGQLEPLSEEEWQLFLANAPEDDEPITESEREGFDELRRLIGTTPQQRAG